MEDNLTKGVKCFFQKTFLKFAQKNFWLKTFFSGKRHFISEKVLFFSQNISYYNKMSPQKNHRVGLTDILVLCMFTSVACAVGPNAN